MRDVASVRLVHGAAPDGSPRVAELRPLTGFDEALLGACPDRLSPARCTTQLLAAAMPRLGDVAPVPAAMVEDLTIGDRERLLLGLCRLTFGPEIEMTAECPARCGETLELAIRFADMLDPPVASIAAEHVLFADSAQGRWRLRFRLPSGRAQQAAAGLADAAAAARALVAACILECTDPQGQSVAAGVAAELFSGPLSDAFERLDPDAEMATTVTCPSCGATERALLDGFATLHTGLGRGERLYAETYRMARAYHWSERAIHALPLARRQRYLALADAMGAA